MKFIRKYGICLALIGFLTISIGAGVAVGKSCVRTELRFVDVIVEKPVEVLVEVEVTPERVYFDVPLSETVQDVIFDECEKRNIPPELVVAIIEKESKFKEDVVGDSGKSFGLMQIQKRWHLQRMEKLGCTDLLDPVQNVKVGIDYLDEIYDMGNGVAWSLMAYNGGCGYANEKTEQGVISNYATSVLVRACESNIKRREL